MPDQLTRSTFQGWVLVVCVAAAIGVASARGALQTPPQTPAPTPRPAGLIVGRVIDGATNTPLAGVTVTLSGAGVRTARAIVDPQGRFVFNGLPPSSFTITANKTGYLAGSYGTLRPDGAGRSLELREGERVTDAVVRLWRFATISGRIVDDAGDPVASMRVQSLRRTIVSGRWRLVNSNIGGSSDGRGVYRISGLQPGEYALVITSHISTLPPSLLSLADALKREPGPEASQALSELRVNGTAGYVNDFQQGFPVGHFGDFLLQSVGNAVISPDGKFIEAYPTVWYPNGATPAEATLITVRSGEDRAGIDLHPRLSRTPRISGTVIGPAGPVPHLALRLVPARLEDASAEITTSISLSLTTGTSATDANGAFTFLSVPPGQYIIRALTTPVVAPPARVPGEPPQAPPVSTDPVWWSATPVSVGETDSTGVTVTMRPGLRVTGRAEFIGASTKPTPRELGSIRITMDPADGRTVAAPTAYRAQIDPEGRFYTIGLIAGSYLLKVDSAPRGWTLKSAMVGGRDICDSALPLANDDVSGLVLTFTDRPSTLSGTVRSSQGQPDDDAAVLIFPADSTWTDLGSSPRRLRNVRASRTGNFMTAGLPAGDYYVIAVSDAVASNWQDPSFLQRLARVASRVTLGDGQIQSLALTTTGGIIR